MANETEILQQVESLLIEFKNWCESNSSKDVEQFVETKKLTHAVATAFRKNVTLGEGKKPFPETLTIGPARVDGARRPCELGRYDLKEMVGEGG